MEQSPKSHACLGSHSLTKTTYVGCNVCKTRRVKCDERKPLCGACTRLGLLCKYETLQVAKEGRHVFTLASKIRSVPSIKRQLSCDPILESKDALYYDYFRTHVISNLVNRGLENFWSRTILQGGSHSRDTGILDALLGIGAISRARSHSKELKQLFRHQSPTSLSNPHYRAAISYYAKAIAKVRGNANHPTPALSRPRIFLVTTLLFLVFELFQGNCDAVDRLTASGISLLEDVLKRDGVRSMASVVDDEGTREAELFLLRSSVYNSMFSPSKAFATFLIDLPGLIPLHRNMPISYCS